MALLVCALGRELDYSWLYRITPASVRIAVAAILVASVAARERRHLRPQLAELLRRPAAILFVVGFVVATCWAQILGERPLWHRLGSPTAGKRMTEESLEFAGYCLIACGVFEDSLDGRTASGRG